MKEEILRLFKDFLAWRDQEWKRRVDVCNKQNEELQKRHMIGGMSPVEVGDGIEEFTNWLNSL